MIFGFGLDLISVLFCFVLCMDSVRFWVNVFVLQFCLVRFG